MSPGDWFNTVAVKRCSCPWHGRRNTRRRLLRSRTQKAGRSAPAILMAMGHGISYHQVLNPYIYILFHQYIYQSKVELNRALSVFSSTAVSLCRMSDVATLWLSFMVVNGGLYS